MKPVHYRNFRRGSDLPYTGKYAKRLLAMIFLLSIVVLMAVFPGYAAADDIYEPNNTLGQAWYPGSNWEGTLLSTIGGLGVESNDDWYRIYVSPGEERVQIQVLFTHALGDIDVDLYDASGTWIWGEDSEVDNEFLDYIVPSYGTYYIRIYSLNSPTNNTYDLMWDDMPAVDDNYEENDTLQDAWYPGYNWEGTLLSTIDGMGVQSDNDWYEISVSSGEERVQVGVCFTHAEGDIDLGLYDSTGNYVASSESFNDNEYIDYAVPGPGTYYIWVGWQDAGNLYDLKWDDLSAGSYPGPNYDLNSDGQINIVDIMLVASRWDTNHCEANYDYQYDLDIDGEIDIVDIMMVAAQWGWTE
jgi:hypothetical protein